VSASEELARVADMTRVLLNAQERVRAAEVELEAAEKALRQITQEDFPELMSEVGMTEVKLEDGTVIKIEPDIRCGITEERQAQAFAWLRDNNFGGIIKSEVSLSFGIGDEESVAAVMTLLYKAGFTAERSDGVHWQTLKSFCKEQREKGGEFPNELFGVFPFTETLVAPKGKGRPGKLKRAYKRA
jgi:hypothetical protein